MNSAFQWIEKSWYRKSFLLYFLWPFSLIYRIVIELRKSAYRVGILRSFDVGVPVVVVGNLTVGGTGKTPLVAELVRLLSREGYSPGIVSRGYKAQIPKHPYLLVGKESPALVGDEPLLLYEKTNRPVMIDPNRVRACRELVDKCEVDIVVSDDGLQHLRMERSVEIVVVDGCRRFGNDQLLPAGPLREHQKCLVTSDFIVTNGGNARSGEYQMRTSIKYAVRLVDGERRDLSCFSSQKIHVVTGIGNSESFFSELEAVGIQFFRRCFPDHHSYRPSDLRGLTSQKVLMTSKDAVKCRQFSGPDWWVVPQEVEIDNAFKNDFLTAIKQ